MQSPNPDDYKGLRIEDQTMKYAKDILVVKQSDFQRHQENPNLIYHTAVTTGKELFRAAS